MPSAVPHAPGRHVAVNGTRLWIEEEGDGPPLVLLAGGLTNRGSEGRIDLERLVDGKKKKWRAKLDEAVEPGDKIYVRGKLF